MASPELHNTCPDTFDANGELHHDEHFRSRTLKREVL